MHSHLSHTACADRYLVYHVFATPHIEIRNPLKKTSLLTQFWQPNVPKTHLFAILWPFLARGMQCQKHIPQKKVKPNFFSNSSLQISCLKNSPKHHNDLPQHTTRWAWAPLKLLLFPSPKNGHRCHIFCENLSVDQRRCIYGHVCYIIIRMKNSCKYASWSSRPVLVCSKTIAPRLAKHQNDVPQTYHAFAPAKIVALPEQLLFSSFQKWLAPNPLPSHLAIDPRDTASMFLYVFIIYDPRRYFPHKLKIMAKNSCVICITIPSTSSQNEQFGLANFFALPQQCWDSPFQK